MTHGLGFVGSLSGVVVLSVVVIPARDALPILAAVVLGAGLMAMLWLSAAYHLIDGPDRKKRFRQEADPDGMAEKGGEDPLDALPDSTASGRKPGLSLCRAKSAIKCDYAC